MASSATYRAASVLSSGVYYGGSAIVSTVNSITPHLAGAVDILVVEQPDGSRRSTPFYVRFGKYAAIRSREREVKIFVNGGEAPFSMVLGSFGQAYFASETVQIDSDTEQHEALGDAMSPVSGYSSDEAANVGPTMAEQLEEELGGNGSTVVNLGTITNENSTTHVQLQHPDNNAATISEVTVYRDAEGPPFGKSQAVTGTSSTKQDPNQPYRRSVTWPALGNNPVPPVSTPPKNDTTLISEQPPRSDSMLVSEQTPADWMVDLMPSHTEPSHLQSESHTDATHNRETHASPRSRQPHGSIPEPLHPNSILDNGRLPNNAMPNGFRSDVGSCALATTIPADLSAILPTVESMGDLEGVDEVAPTQALHRSETRYLSVSSLPSFIDMDSTSLDSIKDKAMGQAEDMRLAAQVGQDALAVSGQEALTLSGQETLTVSGQEALTLSGQEALALSRQEALALSKQKALAMSAGTSFDQWAIGGSAPAQGAIPAVAAAAAAAAVEAAAEAVEAEAIPGGQVAAAAEAAQAAMQGVVLSGAEAATADARPPVTITEIVAAAVATVGPEYGNLGAAKVAGSDEEFLQSELVGRVLVEADASEASMISNTAEQLSSPNGCHYLGEGMDARGSGSTSALHPASTLVEDLPLLGASALVQDVPLTQASTPVEDLPITAAAAALAAREATPTEGTPLSVVPTSAHPSPLPSTSPVQSLPQQPLLPHPSAVLRRSISFPESSSDSSSSRRVSDMGANPVDPQTGAAAGDWEAADRLGMRRSTSSAALLLSSPPVTTPPSTATSPITTTPSTTATPPTALNPPSTTSQPTAHSSSPFGRQFGNPQPSGASPSPEPRSSQRTSSQPPGNHAQAATPTGGVHTAQAAVSTPEHTSTEALTTPCQGRSRTLPHPWSNQGTISPSIKIPTLAENARARYCAEENGERGDANGDLPSARGASLSPPQGASLDSLMSPHSASSMDAGYMGDVERRQKDGGSSFRQGLPNAPGAIALGIQGFELSLCGHLLSRDMGAGEAQQVFEANNVSSEQFAKNAMQLTQSPDLVVRMGTTLYPWSAASPIVLGMLAFGGRWDHLTKEACWKLQDGELQAGTKLTPPRKQQAGWRLWPFGSWGSSSSIVATAAAAAAATTASGAATSAATTTGTGTPPSATAAAPQTNRSYSAPPASNRILNLDSLVHEDPAGGSSDEGGLLSPPGSGPGNRVMRKQHVVVKKKTVGPTSEQLANLPLQEGQNHITYRIGKSTELHAYVYLMKWSARLVISDIDGTITKSDILGHVLPAIGYDWSHPGITQLFTNITQNGYQMMYLSSRSIGQASITRDYIHSLDQQGNKMPQGPVIISPQGILPSLYREMILRRPHEFKIACLKDIRSLFPEDVNPFYAGFGNRDTDLLSYKEVGVPPPRIFIINPKGELRKASSTVQSSTWSTLKAINTLVHEVFPANHMLESRSTSLDESFSDLNYWRTPLWLPPAEDEDEELLKPKPAKPTSSLHFKRTPSDISSDFISSINPL